MEAGGARRESLPVFCLTEQFCLTILSGMRIKFSRSSRKHRIGRASAIAALRDAGEPTLMVDGKLLWLGTDQRGRELELIGFIAEEDPDLVIIIHVMPLAYRKEGHWE